MTLKEKRFPKVTDLLSRGKNAFKTYQGEWIGTLSLFIASDVKVSQDAQRGEPSNFLIFISSKEVSRITHFVSKDGIFS